MVRRELPPTSRIFTRKGSLPSRLLGAVLLGFAVAVSVLGLGAGLYLDRGRAPTAAPLVRAEAGVKPPVASVELQPHDPTMAAAAVVATEPAVGTAKATPTDALATVEPQAGAAAPAPTLPQLAPPAPIASPAPPVAKPVESPFAMTTVMPAPAPAEPPYWVEYGVFAGKHYALRLQKRLAESGIDSLITRTHTPAGRALWRVRSTGLADRAGARAAAEEVQPLKLAALIHHHLAAAAPAPKTYLVQFGTFASRPPAVRLQRQLAAQGITASVTSLRTVSGKLLFLVRSPRLQDRDSAERLAQRAGPFAEVRLAAAPGRPHRTRAPPSHHVAQLR